MKFVYTRCTILYFEDHIFAFLSKIKVMSFHALTAEKQISITCKVVCNQIVFTMSKDQITANESNKISLLN